MPTERFYRLPPEKAGAIRTAAIHEFKRVSLEKASINRIIQDAEISRGSFYTYFKDKYELLGWIIGDRIQEHMNMYVAQMEKRNGDIWEVLEWIFTKSVDQMWEEGFMDIIGNMVGSEEFSDFLRHGMAEEKEKEACAQGQQYVENLYRLLDKERYPISRNAFDDLMEMHGMVFLMSLKRLLRDKLPQEQVKESYKRYIRMLRYGLCPAAAEQKKKERQEETEQV